MNILGTTITARLGAARRTAGLAAVCVIGAVLSTHAPPALAAPINGGSVDIVQPPAGAAMTSGGSSTAFAVKPPVGAACTGDSIAGYRAQSFIVPSTVDLATLQFNSG